MKLVLATNNADKIREIRNLFDHLPVEIMTKDDFRSFPDIEETGTTLEENAKLKSEGIFKHTGCTAIADDTGLEVDALGGAPGVYSSRFAGENATYDDNCNKLLKMMQSIPDARRTARFRTVIAVTWDDGTTETVDGIAEGIITRERIGFDGFGYDPVFYYPPAGKTFAEMTLDEKNKVSHRGLALFKARELIARKLEK
jgi:XTP/dITP diphosphohydrolase